MSLTGALLAVGLASVAPASAGLISFTPDSNGPPVLSPPFGPLAAGGAAGANYINFGVDFNFPGGPVVGIFSDPPDAFGGVNANGILDLITDVDGSIVVPGTTNPATTDYFYAEAGYADLGVETLTVYNSSLVPIGSATDNNPTGAFGRYTFAISTPGIAYFTISSPNDSFGVDDISLNTPVGIGATPLPPTWTMLIAGFVGLGFFAYRGSKKNAALAAA